MLSVLLYLWEPIALKPIVVGAKGYLTNNPCSETTPEKGVLLF